MSKIDLDPITSGYNLSKINANFQKVEDELNNKVLYRDSPAGEPNSMSSNLDMNSKSILNANKISSNILELGGVQVVPTSVAVDPYNGTREALRRSYAEAGYNLVDGSFETGGVLVNANDVLLQEATGKAFSGPAGTVAAGTNPASGGFVDKSEVATSASAISNANGGSVQDFIDNIDQVHTRTFANVDAMLAFNGLQEGQTVETLEFNLPILSKWGVVTALQPTEFGLALQNGLFARLLSDDGDLRHYGVGGDDDETDRVQFALDNGARLFRNIEPSVTSINLPTRDYTFDNSVIKRVDTYTGNDHLLSFADGCQCNGSLIYLESNNAGNDNPSTPVNTCVFGKNFRAGRVIASKINRGTNVVYANRITGDFYCSYMKSSNFDYAGGRVFAADSTGLVRIDTFESINCGVKGFSVNGGMGVDHISFGSYTAKTDSSNTAGDGFLVDTNEDNTVINVQKVTIESYNIGGWYSNAVKVENTDTLSIGDGGLFCGGSNINRSSLRAAVKNLNVGNLKYGSQLRNYAEKSSIQSLTFETNSAAHANNYPYRIDNLFGNVDTVFNINSLTVIGDSALIGVVGAIRVEPSVDKIKGVIGLYNTPNNLNLLSYSTFNTTGNVGMISIGAVNGLNTTQFGPVLSRNTLFQFGLRLFRHTTIPTWGDYKKGDRIEIINPAVGSPWAYVAIADVQDASVDNSNFKALGIVAV